MNFRTTLVLLVLVVAAGIVFFISNNRNPAGNDDSTKTATNEHKLLDVDSKDVTRISITNSDGKRTVLEKNGANWALVEPVKASAKDFEVEGLVNTLTGLQSRGQVDPSQKSAGGLDHPSFTIELRGKNNATTKLLVGDKPPVSDSLLVQLNENKKPDVVSASLYSQLDKPASSFRKSQLVEVTQDQVKQLSITRGKNAIKLEKKGTEWQVVEPKAMPADSSAVSDLLFGITGLNAVDFVSDDASKAASYGLSRSRLTVTYSTQAPSTQPPATTAPATQSAGVTIRFGDYEDVLKKNVFAEVDAGPIAKVPATSETIFNKSPLDLREKNVVSIDPDKVQRMTMQVSKAAATQPTSQPAEMRGFVIERRKEETPVMGPVVPPGVVSPSTAPTSQSASIAALQPATTQAAATEPATQAAATQPSTQPIVATQPATQPASKWFFASGDQGDAEQGQVAALLAALHPLRVDKYLESALATQPAGSYIISIHTTDGKDFALRFTDPGGTGKVLGSYEDLSFEVDRSLLEKLGGDFKTRKPEPTPPPSFGGGGGMPFGR